MKFRLCGAKAFWVEGLDVWGLTPWVVDAAERVPTAAWVGEVGFSVGPRSAGVGWGIG